MILVSRVSVLWHNSYKTGHVVYSGLIKVTLIFLELLFQTPENVTPYFPDIIALVFWGKYQYSVSSSGCEVFT